MDFWSRLLGGSSSSASRSHHGNVTAERHSAFKHIYNTLYQTWRNSPNLASDSPFIPRIRACLDRMNVILSDESRGPSPHPCLLFAASSQVYLTVTKLALSTYDPRIVSATAVFLNMLIDAEVDGIVDSRTFSRALVDLARQADGAGEECEGKLVELIFGVANTIRLRPNILPAWFHPACSMEEGREVREAGVIFAGATRKEDFPLFYLLLDYVHFSGRKGDFARTGLLYIIETASKAKDLERWLIESDLATLMATGLGGLYSQLGRVLPQAHDLEIPPIIALSDDTRLEAFIRYDLGGNMNSFLSYLLFWQDAIDHCKSVELNDTLLDHFQVLFLEQLLYPSLLESSDVDGGSTPAVTTYLSRILESIDQPELIHRILRFLLAPPSENEVFKQKQAEQPKMSVSRRKSLDILSTFAQAAAIPSPALFNLVDLLSISIKSVNNQTLVATLRLVTVILQRHHHFADLLMKISLGAGDGPNCRNHEALNSELGRLFQLAATIYDSPSLDQSYASYLSNAAGVLYPRVSATLWNIGADHVSEGPVMLRTDDSVFRGMMDLMRNFFTNNVITNLALTSAIAALASSNCISLDGWLLDPPRQFQSDKNSNTDMPSEASASPDAQGTDVQSQLILQQPSQSLHDVPVLLAVLHNLVDQVQSWRESISDFDALLAGRKDLLHLQDQEPPLVESEMELGPQLSDGRGFFAGVDPGTDSARGRKSSQGQNLGGRSPSRLTPRAQSNARLSPSRGSSSVRQSSRPPSSLSREHCIPIDLHRRLASPLSAELGRPSGRESSAPENARSDDSPHLKTPDATLGHILTNVVILYEFILEMTALVQMRASIFQEVSFGLVLGPP